MEVAAFLRGPALRTRQPQFVNSVENDFVIRSEFTVDSDPSSVIDSEGGFDPDCFVGIERVAFEEDMGDAIFHDGGTRDGENDSIA
jgi:hypothetical protein